VVCTEHDVVAQAYQRLALGSHGRRARTFQALSRWVARREVSLLNRCQLVRVTNPKDEEILRSRGLSTECIVTELIGSNDPITESAPGRSGPVTFFGALWREENAKSASWFIREVWPRVIEQQPNAQFIAAGASPPADLLELDGRPGVSIRGWVADADLFYAESGVFVAPLLMGAGIKVKVLDAMRHRLPVVATSVGAEGIVETAPPGVLAAVTDDPRAFADAVVGLLTDDGLRRRTGIAAHEWMQTRPTFEDSVVASLDKFRSLVDSKPQRDHG
jgi:hypothetical protein